MSPATPSATGSPPGAESELEKLEELPSDAIVAHQQGAHMPQPRAQVTEEARSIVISEHPPAGSEPPPSHERRSPRRSERTEKTVVIRSRRQIEDLRREMARHSQRAAPPARKRGLLLWVMVGVAAFVAGGLVARLAAPAKQPALPAPSAPALSDNALLAPPPPATQEPPSVSIDQLPIESSSKRKK